MWSLLAVGVRICLNDISELGLLSWGGTGRGILCGGPNDGKLVLLENVEWLDCCI